MVKRLQNRPETYKQSPDAAAAPCAACPPITQTGITLRTTLTFSKDLVQCLTGAP